MYFILSIFVLLSSDIFRQFLEEEIGVNFVPYLVDNPLALLLIFIGACSFSYILLKNIKRKLFGKKSKSNNDAEQERMMNTEHCILVDENDNVIGHDSKKNCHLMANGLKLHRAFSVFLFDSKKRLLLQKRSLDKITFPDYWANTCCSHPLYVDGEKNGVAGVKNAARRKLEQELGITPDQIPLESMTFVTRVHYRASCDNKKWGEHEVDYIIICQPPKDVVLNLNANEVSEARYFDEEELIEFMENGNKTTSGSDLISPWFCIIQKAFLHKWWKKILANESVIDNTDRSKIYRGEMEKIPVVSKLGVGNANNAKAFDTSKKQGSYGKVKIHKHSILSQLLHPLEIAAAVQYKLKSKRRGMLCESAPQNARQEDILFCEDILSSVSRSFAGVIKELPPCLRLPVALFYLVLRALDTIEDEMDLTRFEPYLTDEIKNTYDVKINMLLRFHERLVQDIPLSKCTSKGIGEGDERKLVEEFDKVNRVFNSLNKEQQNVISDITKRMAKGMSDFAGRDLAAGTKNRTEFDLYCHYVAGLVGEGLTRQFVACGLEDKSIKNAKGMQLANSMGLFLQKTNITRDYLEDLVDNRSFYPADVWSLYHNSLPELRHGDDKAMQCVNHIIADTLEHSQDCLAYLNQLQNKDVFRFCAIPQIMAIATLAECYNNRKIFTGVLKIRKGLAARIIRDCDNMKSVKRWFAIFASKIMNSVEHDDPNAQRTIEHCLNIGAKKDMVPNKMLFALNTFAAIVGIFLANRIYHNRMDSIRNGKHFMPKLTDTLEVAEVGIFVVVVIYLLSFSGVVFAANLLNNSNVISQKAGSDKFNSEKKIKKL